MIYGLILSGMLGCSCCTRRYQLLHILFDHLGGKLREIIQTFDIAIAFDVCGERRGWEIGVV